MSRENLDKTLESVEIALEHLASALHRGGFGAGGDSYRQMSEIVMGQHLWAADHGVDEFDDRFRTVARLADTVHCQLEPYVEAMGRLRMLAALVPDRPAVQPGSDEAAVLDAIQAAGRPQSITQLRKAVARPTARLRPLLASMIEDGLIAQKTAGSRTTYRLVGT